MMQVIQDGGDELIIAICGGGLFLLAVLELYRRYHEGDDND